jgi:cathepsin D
VASTYPDTLNSTNFGADGIMGMGFMQISTSGAPTFVQTLFDQGRVVEQVFGFYLAESDSELIIGGRDSSRFSGNLTYVNVDQPVRISRGVLCSRFNTDTIQGFWQAKFDSLSVNGKNIPGINFNTDYATIDTGVTFILGEQESISNIYATIPGSAQLQNTSLWTSTLVTMFDCLRS